MRALDDRHSRHGSIACNDSYALALMKLDPQWCYATGARLSNAEIPGISDLCYRESRPINPTSDYASWQTTSFAHHQVARRITRPSGHRFHQEVCRYMFPARRSIKCHPGGE